MPTIFVNGVSIAYPDVGDSNWGTDATNFAIQVAAALGKIGQSAFPPTNDITVSPGNLSVTSGNLSVGGDASVTGNTTLTGNITVNGNSNLGNGTSDTTAITGILNVDSGVLYVDPTNSRVGINDASPSVELDVNGNVAVTGNTTVGGTFGVTGDVSVNTNKFNVTASSGNTSIAGTLGVTSDITTSGVLTASNSTNVTTAPPITFTGDTNTGIGHSAADTLDYVTGGVSRARLNSTGQQSSVVPDLSGSNTTLYNEYKCRAWVDFNGTTATPSTIRGSGNVSSVTKNATGDYTINFTTSMPDANYSVHITVGDTSSPNPNRNGSIKSALSVGSFTIVTGVPSTGSTADMQYVCCAVFR